MTVCNNLLIPISLDVRIEYVTRNINVECIGEWVNFEMCVIDQRYRVKNERMLN